MPLDDCKSINVDTEAALNYLLGLPCLCDMRLLLC